MKIRYDFVTNSSSTNFVIGCKDELTKEKLLEVFQVHRYHPLSIIMKEIMDIVFKTAKRKTKEEILEYYNEIPEECERVFSKGYEYLYEGELSTDNWDDPEGRLEAYLAYAVLYVETRDFIMEQVMS